MRDEKYWRELCNYLMLLACYMDIHTIEYRNLNRRIRWIWQHRL